MIDVIVRLQEVRINNLKNVEYGKISLESYNNFNKDIKSTDILGIYGQNGSGKTALIDSLDILRLILSGDSLPDDMNYIINSTSEVAKLEVTFLVEILDDKYFVYYNSEILKGTNNQKAKISKEALSYSQIIDGKKMRKIKVIDFDMNFGSESIIKPLSLYNRIIRDKKENQFKLGVSKEYTLENSKSFIFSNRNKNIFHEAFKNDFISHTIINALRNFASLNLFVIKNDRLGVVNMNQLLPFAFRLESNNEIISGEYISLFKPATVSEESRELIKKIIQQINVVINAIIPELQIEVVDLGNRLDEKGKIKVQIELMSLREDNRVPLKYESDGIKKIISILSAIIAMYNNRNICIAVDELDAGIFEYLLGEILNVLQENAKGQFIFTSHNLRALEKLNKESIIFTTANPKNRYLRLANVKSNNNLRDFYLRVISLGGQKEDIYEGKNTFEINYAFRKAGRLFNGN